MDNNAGSDYKTNTELKENNPNYDMFRVSSDIIRNKEHDKYAVLAAVFISAQSDRLGKACFPVDYVPRYLFNIERSRDNKKIEEGFYSAARMSRDLNSGRQLQIRQKKNILELDQTDSLTFLYNPKSKTAVNYHIRIYWKEIIAMRNAWGKKEGQKGQTVEWAVNRLYVFCVIISFFDRSKKLNGNDSPDGNENLTDKFCVLSCSRIQSYTNLSAKTVRDCVRDLEKLNLLTHHEIRRADGSNPGVLYYRPQNWALLDKYCQKTGIYLYKPWNKDKTVRAGASSCTFALSQSAA